MCILSLNIIIDKIYLVLWFWFVVLGVLGGIRVGCRIVQIASPRMRYYLMKIKMHRFVLQNANSENNSCSTSVRTMPVNAFTVCICRYFGKDENIAAIKEYITVCTIGDWFVLYQMSKNLNRRFFYEFLVRLSKDAKSL